MGRTISDGGDCARPRAPPTPPRADHTATDTHHRRWRRWRRCSSSCCCLLLLRLLLLLPSPWRRPASDAATRSSFGAERPSDTVAGGALATTPAMAVQNSTQLHFEWPDTEDIAVAASLSGTALLAIIVFIIYRQRYGRRKAVYANFAEGEGGEGAESVEMRRLRRSQSTEPSSTPVAAPAPTPPGDAASNEAH